MQRPEDNIIREKLEELQELPGNYTPNLASKWSVLEAALEDKPKRRMWAGWKWAAAAAFLGLLSVGFLLNNETTKPPLKTANVPVVGKHQIAGKTLPVPLANPVVKSNSKPSKRKATPVPQQVTSEVEDESKLLSSHELQPIAAIQDQLNHSVVEQELPTKPRTRYIEVDFSDALITQSAPPKPVMAAQVFRLKLGSASVSSTPNTGGRMKLHTPVTFN
jgi:hypothetical protein